MLGSRVVVFAGNRLIRRQIARTLYSTGTNTFFAEEIGEFDELINEKHPDLAILDCDDKDADELNALLEIAQKDGHVPLVLLSFQASKQSLLELINRIDVGTISSLISKHADDNKTRPQLDERELLVTCEKVVRRDIFGIEKYVGSWGILLHQDTITSRADKSRAFEAFNHYLEQLDCPPRIASTILTVTEELILNAVVHAPVDEEGTPKYEHLPLKSEMPLEPNEHVDFRYGCDGQRLMVSVSDNFGRLEKMTLRRCLSRTSSLESKPSGAGVGLSLALSKIHQLIFNVQESYKTEAIAGWYLRPQSTGQFLNVGKSLNVFHLPAGTQPERSIGATMLHFSGRVSGVTDLTSIEQADIVDMRNVESFDDEGTKRLAQTLSQRGRRLPLTIVGCPDSMVRLFTQFSGFLDQARIASVYVPYRCESCQIETHQEVELAELLVKAERRCTDCSSVLHRATEDDVYQEFLRIVLARAEVGAGHKVLDSKDGCPGSDGK